jgi:hypothetical protein
VFSFGAWKNFDDLEDSLNLEELLELYNSSIERFNRMAELMVSALGGEIQKPQDQVGSPQGHMIYDEYDLGSLPINIGYDKVE